MRHWAASKVDGPKSLERGRVALSPGPTFGTQGAGFARLNMATTASLLEEAVLRMARAGGAEEVTEITAPK